MLVLDVVREWKASETSSPKTVFKVGIIHDDDPNFTQPGKVKDATGQSAVCVAGEAVYEMSPNEIKTRYRSKRKRKAEEQ